MTESTRDAQQNYVARLGRGAILDCIKLQLFALR